MDDDLRAAIAAAKHRGAFMADVPRVAVRTAGDAEWVALQLRRRADHRRALAARLGAGGSPSARTTT